MSSVLAALRRRLSRLVRTRRAERADRAGRPGDGVLRRAGTPAYRRYPGDAAALPEMSYEGADNGRVDPGEIVWTWVPYEEDHTQGKDRPVLVIGREGPWLVALQLTSQDHHLDAELQRRAGREWVDLGPGPWDGRRRPSQVRVNRLIRVDPRAVRREGAILPRDRYEEVVAAVRAAHRHH